MLKLQRKIYITIYMLQFFTLNSWRFINKNVQNLFNEIPLDDVNNFDLCMTCKRLEVESYAK